MRDLGIVSVWAGRVDSSEQLEGLLNREYDEDGDASPAELCEGLGLPEYGFSQDLEESNFRGEQTQSLKVLLEGHSYWELVLPRLEELVGPELAQPANAIYMVCDYKHKAPEARFRKGSAEFWFVGSVSYKGNETKLI